MTPMNEVTTLLMNQVTTLRRGSHNSPEDGMCLLEAVAYIAGEPFSDHPECVCPVLAAFGRQLNDSLNDQQRQKLLPYVEKLLNTKSTTAVERKRAIIFADAAVRILAPIALDTDGDFPKEAEVLRNLPEVVDENSAHDAADAASQFWRSYEASAAAYALVEGDYEHTAVAAATTVLFHNDSVECALEALGRAIAVTL